MRCICTYESIARRFGDLYLNLAKGEKGWGIGKGRFVLHNIHDNIVLHSVQSDQRMLLPTLHAWSRVLIDMVAFALLGALDLGVYIAEKEGIVAERRGFFCDDTSIRLPFKHSTEPGWALTLTSVCVPFLAVSLSCLLYTSPSPRDATLSRMPSSA